LMNCISEGHIKWVQHLKYNQSYRRESDNDCARANNYFFKRK
jgi:hypothetical protein